MLLPRIIPSLLVDNGDLVKTTAFKDPRYVGDPINAIRIFNTKEVDELVLLDITATTAGRGPDFDLIRSVASECFMPLAYGGGIRTIAEMERILKLGVEKIVVNDLALRDAGTITAAARAFGSQSVIASIDVRSRLLGRYEVVRERARKGTGRAPADFAREMEQAGAGEILLNAVDRDGTMRGYDLALIQLVARSVQVPVVACGGAGSLADFRAAIREGGASAVAAGAMFVFHGPNRAVLISYPNREEIERTLL